MLFVRRKDITASNGKFYAEASTLGLVPGRWPESIAVLDSQNRGTLFLRGRADMMVNGELAGYRYQSKAGLEMLVIND
jgi:hypothetical protein